MNHLQRLSVVSAFCFAAIAAAAEPASGLRVLVVGNSFSGNALHYLKDIAGAAGCTLDVTHLMVGGSPLKLHWGKAEKALKDPQDPDGKYGENGRTGSLPENLAKGPWDVVTIQQYSKEANDPATYRPFADQLVALIRERAPQARLCIHQTWAYRVDDPRFGTGAGHDLPSAEEMHRQVRAAYVGVAKELKLDIIPVGEAFHLATSDAAWGFKVDPAWDSKTAAFPSLPDQRHSLNVGWSWSKKGDAPKLAYDGHHANTAGEYLAGCVWFETLYHRSAVGNGFHPQEVAAEDAAFLQKIAHQAVEAEGAGK
jgi:hypothetical protein